MKTGKIITRNTPAIAGKGPDRSNIQPIVFIDISKFYVEVYYTQGRKRISFEIRNTNKCCQSFVNDLPAGCKCHIISSGPYFMDMLEHLLARDISYSIIAQSEDIN